MINLRLPAVTALFAVLLMSVGCGSTSEPGQPAAATATVSPEGRDAGAMADLQASDRWNAPRCRWLQTGAWVSASPQETALYRAAQGAGYIEMQEAGPDNRAGARESAWKIALTEAGRAEAAKCPKQSKATSWGLPVSQRKFISGTYVGKDAGDRTIYEVEYAWVPTAIGDQVRNVLTDEMTVEEGGYRTKVYMRNGPNLTSPGPNGWWLMEINDLDAVRLR